MNLEFSPVNHSKVAPIVLSRQKWSHPYLVRRTNFGNRNSPPGPFSATFDCRKLSQLVRNGPPWDRFRQPIMVRWDRFRQLIMVRWDRFQQANNGPRGPFSAVVAPSQVRLLKSVFSNKNYCLATSRATSLSFWYIVTTCSLQYLIAPRCQPSSLAKISLF